MIRTEIYTLVAERLREALGEEIKYIDLWNHNVEFIEEEQPWERPAVFIEFGEIFWKRLGGLDTMRGEGTLKLHLVTDWYGSAAYDDDKPISEHLSAFSLSERIYDALKELRGERFHGFDLMSTLTNHNHEELLENIDVFKFVAEKNA